MINPAVLKLNNRITNNKDFHVRITSLNVNEQIEGRPTQLADVYLLGFGFNEGEAVIFGFTSKPGFNYTKGSGNLCSIF
jgi:hypothetical protein